MPTPVLQYGIGLLLLLLTLVLLLIYYLFVLPRRTLRPVPEYSAPRALLQCLRCGRDQVVRAERGMYVGKRVGVCTCGGDIVITAIYRPRRPETRTGTGHGRR